jgi:hypothetical protein
MLELLAPGAVAGALGVLIWRRWQRHDDGWVSPGEAASVLAANLAFWAPRQDQPGTGDGGYCGSGDGWGFDGGDGGGCGGDGGGGGGD